MKSRLGIRFLFLFKFHYFMKSLDFSKPVTFSILNAMLEKQAFTQLSLSKEKSVSLGQVNKVAKYLLERNLIEKESGSYYLNNAFGLIECIARTREMKDNIITRMRLSLEKKEAINLLGSKGVLCLDTALEEFYPHISSQRICAYIPKKEKKNLLNELSALQGNNSEVWLYEVDLPLETEKVNGRILTSRKRTAIDLVCDNAGFAASDLFKELWGQNIL